MLGLDGPTGERLYSRLTQMPVEELWSELDTQVVLVEPVLALVGWPVSCPRCMRRANRGQQTERVRKRFDLELWRSDELRVVIEVKPVASLSSFLARRRRRRPESRGDSRGLGFELIWSDQGLSYVPTTEAAGRLERNLDPTRWVVWKRTHDRGSRRDTRHRTNEADAVAQLRADCLNHADWARSSAPGTARERTRAPFYAVVTDGRFWAVFDHYRFTLANGLGRPVGESMLARIDGKPVIADLLIEPESGLTLLTAALSPHLLDGRVSSKGESHGRAQ